MGSSSSDGFNEVRIATFLLWGGVLFGVATIAARYYALQAVVGSAATSAGMSLLVAGVIFLFVQSRLIMRLSAGNGNARVSILVIAVLRLFIYLPAFPQMMQVSVFLMIFPVAAAFLQFSALILLFTPPGSNWFAARSVRRRA